MSVQHLSPHLSPNSRSTKRMTTSIALTELIGPDPNCVAILESDDKHDPCQGCFKSIEMIVLFFRIGYSLNHEVNLVEVTDITRKRLVVKVMFTPTENASVVTHFYTLRLTNRMDLYTERTGKKVTLFDQVDQIKEYFGEANNIVKTVTRR